VDADGPGQKDQSFSGLVSKVFRVLLKLRRSSPGEHDVQTISSIQKNILTHNPEQQLSEKAKAFLARPKKLYSNGEFVDAADGETFETEDPALGTVDRL
jgi:hypothetical protein